MYFLFYILFILMVICSECSIIRADRFVFVFCLYFSHLVHRFSQQNGPSIWHKRFLRLLCTSKGKKEILWRFFPFFIHFFSFTDRPLPNASIIHLTLIHPRQQRVQLLHIFFTLRYKILLASVHAFFPSKKHNVNRYDAKDIFLCRSRRALHKCVHGQQRMYS